jgi:hypothetical protein
VNLLNLILMVIGLAIAAYFARIAWVIHRGLPVLSTRPTIIIQAVDEEIAADDLAEEEQADFALFDALLEEKGFTAEATLRIETHVLDRSYTSVVPLYLSSERHIAGIINRQSGYYPAQLNLISFFPGGRMLSTAAPWGNNIATPTTRSAFAIEASSAYSYHAAELKRQQEAWGQPETIASAEAYGALRVGAFTHYEPVWNRAQINASRHNRLVWAGAALITGLSLPLAVVVSGAVPVAVGAAAFLIAGTATQRRMNASLELERAIDADQAPKPDFGFPPIISLSRPQRKSKAAET